MSPLRVVLLVAAVVVGVIGAPLLVWFATTKQRPIDIAAAVGAPIALVIGLLGAVGLLVPGFFDW